MHIGNSAYQGHLGFLGAMSTSVKAANIAPKVVDFAALIAPGVPDRTTSSAAEIANRYDLRNISPREIDQMAKELHGGKHISDSEYGALRSHGADFLSNLPGKFYDEEKLNQKSDLFSRILDDLAMGRNHGTPAKYLEKLLAMLEKIKSLASAYNGSGVVPRVSRISADNMTDLIALQSTTGGIPIDQLTLIDVSMLDVVTLEEKSAPPE